MKLHSLKRYVTHTVTFHAYLDLDEQVLYVKPECLNIDAVRIPDSIATEVLCSLAEAEDEKLNVAHIFMLLGRLSVR